jgi:tetratricopeptide (TPR) repeat protein
MNKRIIFALAIATLFLASCTTPKQIIHHDQLAITASQAGDFQQAINEWNNYIQTQTEEGENIDPKAYAELGKAYYNLKNYEKAEEYFNEARNKNYGDPEMYIMLSERYQMIDNLSKEITALEYYREHYHKAKDSSLVRNRLFETSLESENWEQAESLWAEMDSLSKKQEKNLQIYFQMNEKLDKKDICDQTAGDLLMVNENNKLALDWLAKKYYKRAEDRYQKAMKTYNRKKTNKTYKVLLKELDVVTADFKKSLKYFDVLWKLDDGKKYAKYLANIYVRFGDKKKSQYYKQFIH